MSVCGTDWAWRLAGSRLKIRQLRPRVTFDYTGSINFLSLETALFFSPGDLITGSFTIESTRFPPVSVLGRTTVPCWL
jgi:hypothetical protein